MNVPAGSKRPQRVTVSSLKNWSMHNSTATFATPVLFSAGPEAGANLTLSFYPTGGGVSELRVFVQKFGPLETPGAIIAAGDTLIIKVDDVRELFVGGRMFGVFLEQQQIDATPLSDLNVNLIFGGA